MREPTGFRAATETVDRPGSADSVSGPANGNGDSAGTILQVGDKVTFTPSYYGGDIAWKGVIATLSQGFGGQFVGVKVEQFPRPLNAYRDELKLLEPEPFQFEVGDEVLIINREGTWVPCVGSEGVVEGFDPRRENPVTVHLKGAGALWFHPDELVPLEKPIPYVLGPLTDNLSDFKAAGWYAAVGDGAVIHTFEPDLINRPPHYSQRAGVECADIAETFNARLCQVVQYIWRADAKGDPVSDLKKAAWWLNREIASREGL